MNTQHFSDLIQSYPELLQEDNGELVLALMANFNGDLNIDQAKEYLEENYVGSHKDLEDFAYNLHEETGDVRSIPKHIQPYIDFDRMGRDMEYSGDIFTITLDDGIHVFWNS